MIRDVISSGDYFLLNSLSEELIKKIDKIQTKLKFTVFGKSQPETEKTRRSC